MEAADFRRRSDAFLDAWNRHNVEDVVASYTDHLVYRALSAAGAWPTISAGRAGLWTG
jgi:hypothetical protein